MRKMTKNQDFSAKFSQNQPNLEFIKGQDFRMYDQLALESVSNTNLGQNLKRAKNKDISARLRDQYVFQLLNIE